MASIVSILFEFALLIGSTGNFWTFHRATQANWLIVNQSMKRCAAGTHLRILRRKLATHQKRSLRADAAARKFFERENTGNDREKCASSGDWAVDRSTGEFARTTPQNDRANCWQHRSHTHPGPALRRSP